MTRFRSRTHGMNQRKHSWICVSCGHQMMAKYKVCPMCQGQDIQYFASADEVKRYRQLRLMLRCDQIQDLVLQPTFPIEHKGQVVCTYRGDFQYKNLDGETVVEDVKGFETDVFKLKRKLVEVFHDVKITIIKL